MKKALLSVLAVFLMIVLAAIGCQRIDPSLLEEGVYYHAQHNGKDVVLLIDSMDNKTVYGRWYATANERIVSPQRFIAELKNANRVEVQASAFASSMTTEVTIEVPSFTVDFSRNGHVVTMRFNPLTQPTYEPSQGDYLTPNYQVKRTEDIVYGQASGYWASYPETSAGKLDYVKIVAPKVKELVREKPVSMTMDLYEPVANDSLRRPLLMLIHGGAFFNGDKQSQAFVKWAYHFASLGYVVASINYRLGFGPTKEGTDRAGYKAVQDAHAAMRYLVHHAEDYHINPNYLFVGGSSAGGITALNLAFMRNHNRPATVVDGRFRLTGDSDLGTIDAISPQYADKFSIKAVVNMWGAVHDTAMLSNSPQTAILSFHGDADRIVAYGHDYPFLDPPTPLRDVVVLFGGIPPSLRPINEILYDKMYGSKCIHERAKLNGMHSELHTYPNGPHSLHENDDGTLSDYFKVIQDTTTAFLYQQIVPNMVDVVAMPDGPQWFGVTNGPSLLSLSWKVEGGVVLEHRSDKMRAMFFADAPEHVIHVCGTYYNGIGMQASYRIENGTLVKQ